MPDYRDASGLLKLVRSEPESEPLRAAIAHGDADRRLATAAAAHGVDVRAPGAA